jgi:short-subunit dehydrogenase
MWNGIVAGQVDAAYATTVSGPTRKLEASPRGIFWPEVPHDDADCWAGILRVAPYFTRHVATLGAGISAESGVPTFRTGPDALWENHRVEDVCNIDTFDNNYALVHRFYNMRRAALAGIEPNPAHRAIAELQRQYPDRVRLMTTNVDDLAGISDDLNHFGDLDMAILNAGTCQYLEIADYDSRVIEANITTNVLGTARSLDIALPALRATRAKGKPATLVIVSSSAWWFPFARAEGYGASKAALSYFAHALRADLAAEGIDVVVVSPGFVRTPLTDRNDFAMPFIIDAEDAAQRIRSGLERGKTEIAFPRPFIWLMKVFSALPQSLTDRLAARMARNTDS